MVTFPFDLVIWELTLYDIRKNIINKRDIFFIFIIICLEIETFTRVNVFCYYNILLIQQLFLIII